jgi:hypothetical protein
MRLACQNWRNPVDFLNKFACRGARATWFPKWNRKNLFDVPEPFSRLPRFGLDTESAAACTERAMRGKAAAQSAVGVTCQIIVSRCCGARKSSVREIFLPHGAFE